MTECPGCGEPVGGVVIFDDDDRGVVRSIERGLQIEFEPQRDGRYIGRVGGETTVLHECSYGGS